MGKRTEKQLAEPVRGQDKLFSDEELWDYKYGKNQKSGQTKKRK